MGTIIQLGLGKMAAVEASGQAWIVLVQQLFPEPIIEVSGANDIDLCVARNHGKLLMPSPYQRLAQHAVDY